MEDDEVLFENCKTLFDTFPLTQDDLDVDIFRDRMTTQAETDPTAWYFLDGECTPYIPTLLNSKIERYTPGMIVYPSPIKSILMIDNKNLVAAVKLNSGKIILMYKSNGGHDDEIYKNIYFPFYGIDTDNSIIKASHTDFQDNFSRRPPVIQEFIKHFQSREELFVSAYMSGDIQKSRHVPDAIKTLLHAVSKKHISARRIPPGPFEPNQITNELLPIYRLPPGHEPIMWLFEGWSRLECGAGGDCMFHVIAKIMSERLGTPVTMEGVRRRVASLTTMDNFELMLGTIVDDSIPIRNTIERMERPNKKSPYLTEEQKFLLANPPISKKNLVFFQLPNWTPEQRRVNFEILFPMVQNAIAEPGTVWGDDFMLSLLGDYTNTTFILLSNDTKSVYCHNLNCHDYVAFLYWYDQRHFQAAFYNGYSIYRRDESVPGDLPVLPTEVVDLLFKKCPDNFVMGPCIPEAPPQSFVKSIYVKEDEYIIPVFTQAGDMITQLVSHNTGVSYTLEPTLRDLADFQVRRINAKFRHVLQQKNYHFLE